MEKEFKIKEKSLINLQNYLGGVPHKYVININVLLFGEGILEEIKSKKK